ncbi:hypothetical protein [Seonamhaeicola sp.]
MKTTATNKPPKNWKPNCSLSFANWYKNHVKSHLDIEEDYYLLTKN